MTAGPDRTEGAAGEDVAPRRALILAGGGIRVAWQAGVVQALDEAGLRFGHGDGTSGGIFNLGMLLSGVAPRDLAERWRTLQPRRSISMLPWRRYLGSPTDLPAFGDADGLRDDVFPHLGVDVERIRAAAPGAPMTGTFNVADFTSKTCVAIPNDELDEARLIAGVSLPIFLPAVRDAGRVWTDAVWIKDANLLEAVRRGCTELWVVWCIANTPYWGNGPLEQYVHMIELSANGGLFAELGEIATINERRAAGEAVEGTTEPVVVHVVKPEYPLPLDPDYLAGRITSDTLVAMGYRDAARYLANADPAGIALDPSATVMRAAPLGTRFTVQASGRLGLDQVSVHLTAEVTDLASFLGAPSEGTGLVGRLHHERWGDLLLRDGRFTVEPSPLGRRFAAAGRVRTPDGQRTLTVTAEVTRRGGIAALRRRGLDLALTEPDGSAVAGGRARLSMADLARSAVSFEPSGAHDLRDRLGVLLRSARFLLRG